MIICCYGCSYQNVKAFLVKGSEVLPAQKHLKNRKFWKCPHCRNFVGTRKNKNLAPSGPIATKKIRIIQDKVRKEIYFILEKKKDVPNAKNILYGWLTKKLKIEYRTGWIMSENDAKKVMELLKLIKEKC